LPGAQPLISRFSNEEAWTVFRFGPTFGIPYPDEQFPVEATDSFAKQMVPDLNAMLPAPNPTHKALSELALSVKGAVLMGHSETARAPLEAALIDASGIRGMIVIEPPGGCGMKYTDRQIAFADPHRVRRSPEFRASRLARRLRKLQGLHRARQRSQGQRQNAVPARPRQQPLIMQDKNNLEIADLILDWIDHNVGTKVTSF
jgi:hypothetical protein